MFFFYLSTGAKLQKNYSLGKVLIVGKGTAGRSLAEDIISRGGEVIGYLDDYEVSDDVLGHLRDANRIIKAKKIDTVFFAIPSAQSEILKDFLSTTDFKNVELGIIPRTYKIVAKESVQIDDLTDLDVLDLVGRAPIKHDMIHAKEAFEGKTVLVTGAAGSIGSRLVTQLLSLNPKLLVGIDRSENGLFHLGNDLSDEANLQLVVSDIQSQRRISQIFNKYKPDFVFHAAAYKHVPLMQSNPIEAINNNIWGTYNLLENAGNFETAKFVYVSTDKAVNPANVMGATKRVGELLIPEFAKKFPKTQFTGVRFGNVLQSEGSVMQVFRKQLAKNQPLTVTHPEITRYFMTIDEASQLIIQAGLAARDNQLFVLDMGEPIKVADLAQGLIDAINPELPIDYIGLRPGEKMYEELSYSESEIDKTTHPKIFVVKEEDRANIPLMKWVNDFISLTREYEISSEHAISKLNELGFSLSDES